MRLDEVNILLIAVAVIVGLLGVAIDRAWSWRGRYEALRGSNEWRAAIDSLEQLKNELCGEAVDSLEQKDGSA